MRKRWTKNRWGERKGRGKGRKRWNTDSEEQRGARVSEVPEINISEERVTVYMERGETVCQSEVLWVKLQE